MTNIRQTMNRFIGRLKIRRKYKDVLFRRCFADKKDLQSDILRDIIGKQRSEVFNLLLNEFDVKIYERGLKAEGKAEDIIELLEEVGDIPDSLRNRIMRQTNLETLSRWHKLAARAQSIEDFEQAIGLVKSDLV